LKNFKWKSQFVTWFVGAFILANLKTSVEAPEQLPLEPTGRAGRQQLANHKPFSLISLSNIRNQTHHCFQT